MVGVFTGAAMAIVLAALVVWVPRWWSDDHAKASDSSSASVPAAWIRPRVSADGLAHASGVKITQLAITGDGGLVDLRYQIVDPDAANVLHDKNTPPGLVDEESGLLVNELFMEHAHKGPFHVGETYYLVFNNPGNLVQRGHKITVLLGNAQVEHVVVR